MDWTFGIITHSDTSHHLPGVLASIDEMRIPENKYEIVVIGGNPIEHLNLYHIPFDESIKSNWITRKKNMVAENACFDNMVIIHDYVGFKPSWYENFVEFGDNWDVCMNRILNTDGRRFRDWVSWEATDHNPCNWVAPSFIPYANHSRTKKMYVSGSYLCVKRSFLCENRFDESYSWGQTEDGEWSCRVRNFWNYRCNPKSVVQFLKHKQHFPEPTDYD